MAAPCALPVTRRGSHWLHVRRRACCSTATLTVWVNGERKGVMVRPGMTIDSEDDSHGEPVARLDGPLRWAVEMASTSTRPWSVTIGGPLPPPA